MRVVRVLAVVGLIATLWATPIRSQQGGWRTLAEGDADSARLSRAAAEVAALEADGDLRALVESPDTLLAGRRHQFLQQYHNGLRVVGGVVRRQVTDGHVASVFGTVLHGVETDTVPVLDGEAAGLAAQRAARGTLRGAPELVVWTDRGGRAQLAYEVSVVGGGDVVRMFVDARSGVVLERRSSWRTQAAVGAGSGVLGDRKKLSTLSRSGGFFADDRLRPASLVTFDLRGDLGRTIALLEGTDAPSLGDVASDADNQWTDAAVVDAHANIGRSYDFLFERFGRRDIDDRDGSVRAIVHPINRYDLFGSAEIPLELFTNAFWCGLCGADGRGLMVFGEGLPPGVELTTGQTVDFLSAALDVVAHELAHGVTDHASKLEYEGESGALNEAFSDILGVATEFFAQPAGSGPLRADYAMGEDVISPGAVRLLSDPLVYGDPDHYAIRYRGEDDNGGVHTNATIVGHAFYLAVEGGVNRTSGRRVTGVGASRREQIEKAYYRGFVSFLTPRATFADARAATILAAREMYGAGSDAARAIAEAWTAVGVGE